MKKTVFGYFRRAQQTKPLHFLHIGKTGGTAIRHALKGTEGNQMFRFEMHSHPVTLQQIPAGEPVVFFLRDPIKRFSSGFVSRLRQGRPRYNVPWLPSEETAFAHFQSPGELAKHLYSDSVKIRQPAEAAMNGINHVRFKLADWLINIDYLKSRQDDIFFIGFQESLALDFVELRKKLNLDSTIELPQADVSAHRNPANIDREICAMGMENLRKWFAVDYQLYRFCQEIKLSVNSNTQ